MYTMLYGETPCNQALVMFLVPERYAPQAIELFSMRS
jgi:hypothetical protein